MVKEVAKKKVKSPAKKKSTLPLIDANPAELGIIREKIGTLVSEFTKEVQSIGENAGIILDVSVLIQPQNVNKV